MQTKQIEDLIKRSNDTGDGWRLVVSDFVWSEIEKNADPVIFETKSEYQSVIQDVVNYIRIRPLHQQIKNWEDETKKEIALHDRLENSKVMASKLFC